MVHHFLGLCLLCIVKKFDSIRTKLTEEIDFEVCPYGDSGNGTAAAARRLAGYSDWTSCMAACSDRSSGAFRTGGVRSKLGASKVCFDCLLSRQHLCQKLLQSSSVCKDYSKSKVGRFLRHGVQIRLTFIFTYIELTDFCSVIGFWWARVCSEVPLVY